MKIVISLRIAGVLVMIAGLGWELYLFWETSKFNLVWSFSTMVSGLLLIGFSQLLQSVKRIDEFVQP